ncbi:MAG: clostripain-related cysteine peptidase [Candidatus Thorarchaeota archaeon]
MEKQNVFVLSAIVVLLSSFLLFCCINFSIPEDFRLTTEVKSASSPSTTQTLGFDLESQVDRFLDNSSSEKSWTYMLYLDADNDIEADAVHDLEEIERGGGGNSEINVLILVDRVPGYDNSHGNWSGSRYYLASEDQSSTDFDSILLEDLGEVDMSNPTTLINFLNFCFENYPAKNYCLDLWNHGWGAYGMCIDETDSNDENNGLSLDNLQYAIRNSTNTYGTEIAVISMDACDMNTLEVAWELRNLCKYFIATEDVTLGYEYEPIVRGLLDTPEMTAFELCRLMVDTYANEFDSSDFTCLSVINESLIPDVTTYINNFTAKLTNVLIEYGYETLFSWIRKTSHDFFGGDFVDLITFTEKIESFINHEPLKRVTNKLVYFLEQLVAYNWQQSSYQGAARGISIFLPYNDRQGTYYMLNNYVNQIGVFEGMDWQRDSQWDEFLELYWQQSYYVVQPDPSRLLLGDQTDEFSLTQAEEKLYRIRIWQETIYEFTCKISSGDIDMLVLSSEGYIGGSYLINPNDGTAENCRFYLPRGSCYILLKGKNPSSHCTVEVNKFYPQNISCNTPHSVFGGTKQGDSNGHYIQDLFHYFQVEIEKGNYTIVLSNSEAVNYQLTIYNYSWTQIISLEQAGMGKAITFNYNPTDDVTILYFEVIGLEGAGSFTIEIIDNEFDEKPVSSSEESSTSHTSNGFLYSFIILLGVLAPIYKKKSG